ncbi:MAG: cytochrome P450 [Microlunatus sp.]|nr:cytochrome P450 [Microlunatus sp.]
MSSTRTTHRRSPNPGGGSSDGLAHAALGRLRTAREGARIIGGIYRDRAVQTYAARVRRDPLARLHLPAAQDDPYPIYDQIRARGPLSKTRLGDYVSASHSICTEVVRSRSFGAFDTEPAPGDPSPREMLDLSLLQLNPPEHTRLRRLAAPAFTPRRMVAYEALVEQRIHRLLDAVDPAAGFDLVRDFAAPLPIAVISELLGVPDVDEAEFAGYGSTLATALDGLQSIGHVRRLVTAQRRLYRVFEDLFERRTAEPRDDLVSTLLAKQSEQADQITPATLSALCRLLLVAGFETTVNAIGNGVRALLADPEQWRLLVEDPSRAQAAVEEVLRYDPPVQLTGRAVLTDTELAGVALPSGRAVVLLLAGANRDPDAYDDPNHFDLTRTPGPEHLAFSGGIHYCLGAPLARLELAAALRALALRLPDLRLAGPVRMARGTAIHGAVSIPVKA